MSSKEINVVKAFIAAINRRNPADIADLMTDDHTFVDSGGGIQSGRETMTAGWKEYFRMFPDYEIHVEKTLSDKALVAVFGSASGTYKGKRGLVPENRITMPAAWKALVEKAAKQLRKTENGLARRSTCRQRVRVRLVRNTKNQSRSIAFG
jgi:predicted ester cyclase